MVNISVFQTDSHGASLHASPQVYPLEQKREARTSILLDAFVYNIEPVCEILQGTFFKEIEIAAWKRIKQWMKRNDD